MKLSVGDRFVLLSLLPEQGTFKTTKLVRELRETVQFSEEESLALKFVQEEGQVRWTGETPDLDVSFKKLARDVVYDALKKLDEDGELKIDHLPMCEKFEYEG